MLKIPTGISDFRKIREEQYVYIDKSYFLEEFFRMYPAEVSLITRPRRFGKTLTMSMLAEFFDIHKKSAHLFDTLYISNKKSFCDEWMNQYPVLSISLKEMNGNNFTSAIHALRIILFILCKSLRYLLDSQHVDSYTKEILTSFQRRDTSLDDLRYSILLLSTALYDHWNKPVILLIDEYDVPLHAAWQYAYYEDMVTFLRGFLGGALKDNPCLKFAVVTGCIRITKESIFTGVNNFTCYTVSHDCFSDVLGFTDEDVDHLLNEAGLPEKKSVIKEWYDGYRFGENTAVYCPWDILQYLRDLQQTPSKRPQAYWINTSENAIVQRLVEKNSCTVQHALEVLVNGGVLRVPLSESMTFDAITRDPSLVWSVLYATGYLTKTCDEQKQTEALYSLGDWEFETEQRDLSIPNKEIRHIFLEAIRNRFQTTMAATAHGRTRLLSALWNGDAEALTQELNALLMASISFFDIYEYFYHAFLTGLFAGCEGLIVQSNREQGLGRPDITITEANGKRTALIEVKHLKILPANAAKKFFKGAVSLDDIVPKDTEDTARIPQTLPQAAFTTTQRGSAHRSMLLAYLATAALQQIQAKQYAASVLYASPGTAVLCYGIAFCQKTCSVRVQIVNEDTAGSSC